MSTVSTIIVLFALVFVNDITYCYPQTFPPPTIMPATVNLTEKDGYQLFHPQIDILSGFTVQLSASIGRLSAVFSFCTPSGEPLPIGQLETIYTNADKISSVFVDRERAYEMITLACDRQVVLPDERGYYTLNLFVRGELPTIYNVGRIDAQSGYHFGFDDSPTQTTKTTPAATTTNSSSTEILSRSSAILRIIMGILSVVLLANAY